MLLTHTRFTFDNVRLAQSFPQSNELTEWPADTFFVQTVQLIAQPTQFLDKCREHYGDTFTTRVLGLNSPPVVFFGNPDAIQEIFSLPSSKVRLSQGNPCL
jgi:cytochrome P450